jgi:hypothetical protein
MTTSDALLLLCTRLPCQAGMHVATARVDALVAAIHAHFQRQNRGVHLAF